MFTTSQAALEAPGVYLRRRPPVRRTVLSRTDVVAFVGVAYRGPLHEPMRIRSWRQFRAVFGKQIDEAHLAYAVQGFFDNGGAECWVVRAGNPAAMRQAEVVWETELGALRFRARDFGRCGNEVEIVLLRRSSSTFQLSVKVQNTVQETFDHLSLDRSDERFIANIVNGPGEFVRWTETKRGKEDEEAKRSQWIVVDDASLYGWETFYTGGALSRSSQAGKTPQDLLPQLKLVGGIDGLSEIKIEHLTGETSGVREPWGLKTLEGKEEISIVAIPDLMPLPPIVPVFEPPPPPPKPRCCTEPEPDDRLPWPTQASSDAMPTFSDDEIERAQKFVLKDCFLHTRFALLDLPRHLVLREAALEPLLDWRKKLNSGEPRHARNGAIYYPWLKVRDRIASRPTRELPPSGHIAGVMARTRRDFGISKPPANELLEEASDATVRVDDSRHGLLNENHINVLRALPGRGLRIMGARTLSDPRAEGEWRYVNVRRLVLEIMREVEPALRDLVFDSNGPRLWADMRAICRTLLDQLWQEGALDGATPAEAYKVICDETTNPPDRQDRGEAVCFVEFLPPHPAEYVILQIGKTESGTQIAELAR